MPSVTASALGQTVTTNYTTGGSLATDLPNLPEVTWASLNPVAGENFETTLSRLTKLARVVLPAGTFNVSGVDSNGYGFISKNVLGFRGAGIDQTILYMVPNSVKTYVTFPNTAVTFGRFGPNGGSSQTQQTSLSDLTIQGSVQNDASGNPMNTNALMNYYGFNFLMENVKIKGLNYGSGNSPSTGETFAINMFHDKNSIIKNVEVDGRDTSGNQITASPLGCNNSQNVTLQDCYFHDTGWSGLTFSYTGSPSTASATNGITTTNVKVAHNANHYITKSGARMPGFNHEQVLGPIRHYSPDIQMDNAQLWDTVHMYFTTQLTDNADIEIWNPIWHESAPKNNGAFTIQIAGNQKTVPKVFDANGNAMTPVMQSGQPSSTLNVNPATQFVCYH